MDTRGSPSGGVALGWLGPERRGTVLTTSWSRVRSQKLVSHAIDRETMQFFRPGAVNQNRHGDRDVESCLVLEYNVPANQIRKPWHAVSMQGRHVQSVNDTRDPTEDGQTDVDEEISTTSPFKENTQGREDDREKDLADITKFRLVSWAPTRISLPVLFISALSATMGSGKGWLRQRVGNRVWCRW